MVTINKRGPYQRFETVFSTQLDIAFLRCTNKKPGTGPGQSMESPQQGNPVIRREIPSLRKARFFNSGSAIVHA